METHSSILAWKFQGQRNMVGLQRVSHDWAHQHKTFELVNQIKQISLLNVGGPHPIRWRPNRLKKMLNFPQIRENSSCLMALEVGHWIFPVFWFWTKILSPSEYWGCWLQLYDCLSWISRLGLQILGFVNLHNHINQCLIINLFIHSHIHANHSSIIAWKIPWIEEPGRL